MALSQRQVSPIPHNCIKIAPIFLDLLNILCASCVLTYLWPAITVFSVGFIFLSFLSHSSALQSRAQHSKAEQRTAKPPPKHDGPATHTRTLEDNTHAHIAQHDTAQPCSIAYSREVPHTLQSTPEHKSIPVVQQHTAEHAQRPAACTQRTAQHNCNTP